MSTRILSAKDALGVHIWGGDRVMVTAYGGSVRASDVRRVATVTGLTPRGKVALQIDDPADTDPIARGRNVDPGMLQVLRRDGGDGFEGNRP